MDDVWRFASVRVLVGVLVCAPGLVGCGLVAKATIVADAGYGHVAASADGSGIVYLDRETAAPVMGHETAARPQRDIDARYDLVVRALTLKPGMQVADIGAGFGDLSWRIAGQVGPTGRVYAVDVQPKLLDRLALEMKRRGVANVEAVLGATDDPRLPSRALDVVVMFEVYHEFDHPREMLAGIVRSLNDDGRVIFVEYRAEDPAVPIQPHHRMSVAQLRREAEAAGLVYEHTVDRLPWQHIVIFRNGPPH